MSDRDCCSIIDQCFQVNGVAVLRHQTPNLHCCSPDYDVAIIIRLVQCNVKSKPLEHNTEGKFSPTFFSFTELLGHLPPCTAKSEQLHCN